MDMTEKNGLIIAFTGPGKGKTTAALGIALRAAGHGKKTVIVQFLKENQKSGEQLLRDVPLIEIHAFGAGFFRPGDDPQPQKEAAEKGWKTAENMILSGGTDILVLDEVSHAINLGFLPQSLILETLRRRKKGLHIILTGRDMPQDLIEIAHIATEMKELRHIYTSGQPAVKGIDY